MQSVDYTNGGRIENQYESADRLTRLKHVNPPNLSVLLQLDYAYTNRGLIDVRSKRAAKAISWANSSGSWLR